MFAMPKNLRAALKGLLKRTQSPSGSTASSVEPAPAPGSETQPTPDEDGLRLKATTTPTNIPSTTTSRQSSIATPCKSPSKFSVQDSIREEDFDFHDAASEPRPSTRSTFGSANSCEKQDDDKRQEKEQEEEQEQEQEQEQQQEEEQQQEQKQEQDHEQQRHGNNPTLLIHYATPDDANGSLPSALQPPPSPTSTSSFQSAALSPSSASKPHHPRQHSSTSSSSRPSSNTIRRQSLVNGANARLLHTLLDLGTPPTTSQIAEDYFAAIPAAATQNIVSMLSRKIWVKRPSASATMVSVREDDLVDDVRDMIMKKYQNSLGRSYDSPDIILRIATRLDNNQRSNERMLGPEEDICRTLDSYYPGGQTVDEALIIEIPARRTPRPSPRAYHASYAALDDFRPAETGSDYFPPMPAVIAPSAPVPAVNQPLHPEQARSIAVLSTGQIPVLPSPGSARRHRGEHRPKFNRQHTSSPTILSHNPPPSSIPLNPTNLSVTQHLPVRQGRPRVDSSASDQRSNVPPQPQPLPTPPAPEAPPTNKPGSNPPTPAARDQNTLRPSRPRRPRKTTPTDGTSTTGNVKSPTANGNKSIASLLDGSVPPINVLIVEDNIINLKLLEAFMKRLKVRWSTAMNGQIAVNKWRAGGFHLVLMDIQLPIMSGLEATKEIRRLERVNGIGVFSNTSLSNAEEGSEEAAKEKEDDKLTLDGGLFKSPVIIVALTASSLQSDRHEALAAGCNDFLTKPVNYVWLERKVKEWGCMQALIDFDGWRKWKDFASSKQDPAAKSAADKLKEKKAKRVSRASIDGPPKSPQPPELSDTPLPPPQNNSSEGISGET